jgi:predicted DNA binding CopG/RHH family protein
VIKTGLLRKSQNTKGGEILKEKKTVYIQIKATETEKEKIKKKAEKRGLSVSAYIRWKALN